MTPDQTDPIEISEAHRTVQRFLDSAAGGSADEYPLLEASLCVQHSEEAIQADGAAALAEIADDDTVAIKTALYDLLEAVDTPRTKTRVHVLGTLVVIARLVPQQTAAGLADVVPRVSDTDPLVREAACSTIAQIAHGYGASWNAVGWDDLSIENRRQFRRAIDPLFTQIDSNAKTDEFEWEAAFDISFPKSTFRGPVTEGERRRPYIHTHATFVIGLLADLFPEPINERSQVLTELAFEAEFGETRGYAVDALGRAGARDSLRAIRSRACGMLEDEETREKGISILHSLTMESPDLLVDVAPALVDRLDSVADRTLVPKIVMTAAAYDPSGFRETVRQLSRTWLSGADDSLDGLNGFSAELLADVAVEHPELILPSASHAVRLQPSDGMAVQDSDVRIQQVTEWNADRAWETLIETAADAPAIVWENIDTTRLRSKLEADAEDRKSAWRLYARAVPTPPPAEELNRLLDQTVTDNPGTVPAGRILAERDSMSLIEMLVAELQGQPIPPRSVLKLLAEVSAQSAAELQPLEETLFRWNETIDSGDDRWPELIDVICRIAITTESEEVISRLLHLEEPAYCRRFLETEVSSDVIRQFPTEAVPPLLEHISNRNHRVYRHSIRAFDHLPGGYGGLSEEIQTVLLQQLSDSRWHIRVEIIRVLQTCTTTDVRTALEDLLTRETNPIVRFEAKRALRNHE